MKNWLDKGHILERLATARRNAQATAPRGSNDTLEAALFYAMFHEMGAIQQERLTSPVEPATEPEPVPELPPVQPPPEVVQEAMQEAEPEEETVASAPQVVEEKPFPRPYRRRGSHEDD